MLPVARAFPTARISLLAFASGSSRCLDAIRSWCSSLLRRAATWWRNTRWLSWTEFRARFNVHCTRVYENLYETMELSAVTRNSHSVVLAVTLRLWRKKCEYRLMNPLIYWGRANWKGPQEIYIYIYPLFKQCAIAREKMCKCWCCAVVACDFPRSVDEI